MGIALWFREHRMALTLALVLLAVGALAVFGVGNDGMPWGWDSAGVGRAVPGADSVARGVSLVVLLPVGGLITASFRRAGLRTFGSFTPSLIALGLVRSPWTVWVLIFGVSLATAMTGRLLVGRLRVDRRARLSLVVMILAATTVVVASLSARMGLGAPAGGVMLPMVALTIMVEHFHYDVETKGLNDALQRLGRTLLVALVSFGVFSLLLVDDLAVRAPGIAFVVAAALIFVGLSRGPRSLPVEASEQTGAMEAVPEGPVDGPAETAGETETGGVLTSREPA
jgi:hypothetical protein